MISPVLLSRFLKVSPQASPFLCTEADPFFLVIIAFCNQSFFFKCEYVSVSTFSVRKCYLPPRQFLQVEREVRIWEREFCHWIIESERGLAWRNLKDHPVQPSGHLSLNQTAQSSNHPGLEHLQGWGIHNFFDEEQMENNARKVEEMEKTASCLKIIVFGFIYTEHQPQRKADIKNEMQWWPLSALVTTINQAANSHQPAGQNSL